MAILKNLLVNGSARFLNTLYANDLTVSGTTTFADLSVTGNAAVVGTLNVGNGNNANTIIKLNGKQAIAGVNGTSYTWLRINDTNAFTSGVYFGSSIVRTDGSFQIGNAGANINMTTSAATFKVPININGTTYKWTTDGSIVANGITASSANISTGKMADLEVTGVLRTYEYDIDHVANLGGNFLVTPTIKFLDGTVTITSISKSNNVITMTIKDASTLGNTANVTSIGNVDWLRNAKIKIAGEINGVVLGTCDGKLEANLNATAGTMTVSFTYTGNRLADIPSSGTVATSNIKGLTVMLTETVITSGDATTHKIGIYMTARDSNNYSHISMYNGVSDTPTVRIGNLSGLPSIGNTSPDDFDDRWGIYTSNGFFDGVVVAREGIIGDFTLNEDGKMFSNNHMAYNTAVSGIYIGDDYISFGSGGVTYFKDDGTGKIGAWNISATAIYSGTYGSDNSTYLSTANMSSKAIAGRTGADWRFTVGSHFGVTNTGAVYANSGTIGGASISNGVLQVTDANISGTISGTKITAGTLAVGALNSTSQSQVLNSEIEVGGKNLFVSSAISYTSLTLNNFSTTESISYSGTASGGANSIQSTLVYPSGQYTINYSNSSGTKRIIVSVKPTNDTSSWSADNTYVKGALGTDHGYWRDVTSLPYTFTMDSEFKIGVVASTSASTTGTISNFKLESGNVATDWTPAPEDIESVANTALSQSVWYATCPTAAATAEKVATINPATTAFTLTPGVTVNVKFDIKNSAGVSTLKLNVNGTGAKSIKYIYNGTLKDIPGATYLNANQMYQFRYDGTYWVVEMIYNTDNDTYNRTRYQAVLNAANTITASRIICGTSSGYRNIGASVSFDLTYPLLYAATAIATGATSGTRDNNYLEINGITYSNNGTITSGAANKTIYLKGTVSGNTFTIAASPFLTTVVPSSADGCCYIPLGIMTSATVGYFRSSSELWAYKDGAFGPVSLREASAAAKTATNYLTQISGTTGISVHDSGDTSNFVNMNSNGVFVYKGGTQRAQFADTTIIGKPFVDGASNNESHVEIGSNYLKLVSKDNTPYFQVQDLRDPSTGLASLEELYIGDGTTTVFQLGLTASNNTYTVKQNGTIVSPTKTVTKVTFATAPALNDEILIIYTSSDPNAKAFTYGSRDPLSNVGAMSFAEGFQVESEGPFSHAEGYRSNASGRHSHAEGNNTTASGNFSHAEGYTTNASGYNSHAEGYHTEASGGISHAEGQSTIASGSDSHAEGRSTSATNSESHAEGYGTEASGSYSHAEGSSTTASGMDSHAEGSHTVASGWHSHAEGSGNTATSSAAHAEGYGTNATGNYSHAEGRLSTASGIYSHAQNLDTKATMSAQTVIGTRNIADTTPSTAVHPSGLTDYGNYAFIIGNGTADDARSNALIVDWNGGLEMYLDVDSSANASTAATSGTDMNLFNAIRNLGWYSDVIT